MHGIHAHVHSTIANANHIGSNSTLFISIDINSIGKGAAIQNLGSCARIDIEHASAHANASDGAQGHIDILDIAISIIISCYS